MQQYSNHRQFDKPYLVGLILALIFLIGAIRNAFNATEENDYDAWLLVLAGALFIYFLFLSRRFALKAQDRAIRAEENLRHMALTGKLLPGTLTIHQIIALRFAPDAEFASLAQRAATGNMSSNDIKKAIQNWRGDYHRV